MNKIKTFIGIIALAVIMFLAYTMYNDLKSDYIPENISQSNIAEESIDFAVVDENGNKVDFSSLYGKPSVINIWATWCPYCIEEFPDFQAMYDKYKDEINFLMINATDGQNETMEKAAGFIRNTGYTFPVYYDVYFEASETFSATHLPTTFFIDSRGNAVTYARGKLDGEALEKGIKIILEK